MVGPQENYLISGVRQDEPNWQNAVVYDWIEPPKDIEATAIAIAKICNFNFIPSLIPFSDDRAIFFCNSADEVTLAANKGIIKISSTTVLLNKYQKMVNAIDTNYSKFRG